MSELDAALVIQTTGGTRRVILSDYLSAAAAEAADREANAWIKSLRHARVDGLPLRTRFTYRGDSLWWFAELYFHKRGRIAGLWRVVSAVKTLIEREQPT